MFQDNSHVTRVQKPSLHPTSIKSGTKIHDYLKIWELQRNRSYVAHISMQFEFYFLNSVNNRQPPRLSNGLAFRISSTHEILKTQTCLQYPNSVPGDGRPNDIIVTIPAYNIASLLFPSYESSVDHLCHILHIPTLWSLMKNFYLRISQSESVLPGQGALLLSILAIAAHFYQPFNNSEVATTKPDAIDLSKILSRGALTVLDFSRRNTLGTLEDVQATILMSFVAYHIDGLSARGRILLTSAVSIARELHLHRLDADNELSVPENETGLRRSIDREVKRRVFWHIASTDWFVVEPGVKPTHCLHLC